MLWIWQKLEGYDWEMTRWHCTKSTDALWHTGWQRELSCVLWREQYFLKQQQPDTYALSGHPVVGTAAAVFAKCQGLFNRQMWTQLSVYMTSWDGVWNSIFHRQKISSHHLESLLWYRRSDLAPKEMSGPKSAIKQPTTSLTHHWPKSDLLTVLKCNCF